MTSEQDSKARRAGFGELLRWVLLPLATAALSVLLVLTELLVFNAVGEWSPWKVDDPFPLWLAYLTVVHALIANLVVRSGAFIVPERPGIAAWSAFGVGAAFASLFAVVSLPDKTFQEMPSLLGVARDRALGDWANAIAPLLSAVGTGAVVARRIAARDGAADRPGPRGPASGSER